MPGFFDGTPLERPVTPDPDRADPAKGGPRPGDQHPRVRREKRRGKWSTVITGLDPSATDHKALLKQLRTALGTGGGVTTVNDRGESEQALVLQGDHKAAAVDRLKALGYNAKPSGG
ncbi:MAG: translation initiation factor [Planctomycetota bacterium]